MVKDVKNGICYRADKLLEEVIEKLLKDKKKKPTPEEVERLEKIKNSADSLTIEELDKIFAEFKIKAPETNNELTGAMPFNLMFGTQIGPTGEKKGYLRPETAQGIFINFRRLIEFNNGKMPFAAAQIGLGFRNEIHPKQGLLRVREFTMAEIEHFVDPNDKKHPKFESVADIELPLLSQESQATDMKVHKMKLRDAVSSKTIDNETLAYFMARSYLFLQAVGIKPEGIRYRQHL